jgi:flagellar motor switch protein FliN/FliY
MSESSAAATMDVEHPVSAIGEAEQSPVQPVSEPLAAIAQHAIGDAASRPLVANASRLDLLRNVEMDVTAELGSTRMTVRELLSLTPGNVVELNRAAGSPIDLLVNGTLIARGEVVVVDEEFGIRISEIVNPGAGENA